MIKLQVEACNFIRKEALAQLFSCEFCKISKNTFFTEHLWATASTCSYYILMYKYECQISKQIKCLLINSHRKCSLKKGVLKNFTNFTGNHLCWGLYLIKLQAWRPASSLKKRLQHRCFPVKFLRAPVMKNICERLLLFNSILIIHKTD